MKLDELKELKNAVNDIKERGYISDLKMGKNGALKTYLSLLPKKTYKDIDIKVKKEAIGNYLVLFNAPVEGKSNDELKRLKDKYGYYKKDDMRKKIFNFSVQANTATFVGNRFLFRLEVDYERERISLLVYDKNNSLIEDKSYWSFKLVKERFESKKKKLLLVKAWEKTENLDVSYKFYDYQFKNLIDFETFIKLISDGYIRITFKVVIARSGVFKGKVIDKGTSFEIQDYNLNKLYI